MPTVRFEPSGTKITASHGSILLDCAREAGEPIESPCGGRGACGKCRVRVVSGAVNPGDFGALTKEQVEDGQVLACKATVLDTDLVIDTRCGGSVKTAMRADRAEDAHRIDPDLFPGANDCVPLVQSVILEVPEALPDEGLSDLDRLIRAMKESVSFESFDMPLTIMQSLPHALRDENGTVTVTYALEDDGARVRFVRVLSGEKKSDTYGVAVDIGTTTIAVRLVRLSDGELMAEQTDYNAQVSCGLDVISRIDYTRKPGRLKDLRSRVVKTVNDLLTRCTSAARIHSDSVLAVVVAGNTTMIHLFLGIDPAHIRLDPYVPALTEVPPFRSHALGLSVFPEAEVRTADNVGSYLGGDITAGLLCTDFARESEEIGLFIDIGTNGELVVGNSDFLIGCACSAGPAFEGGGIESGMRAGLGAIERVSVDESGKTTCFTIGEIAPIGICGSGMISLVAELFRKGLLDQAGRLNRESSAVSRKDERNARFELVPASESGTGEPIEIAETEIQNLIRAKAAVYSACALVLKQVEMGFEDLSVFNIAGGFGRYLDVHDARTIGLIPDLPEEKFRFLGNTSLVGAQMMLLSERHRRRHKRLARRITYLELNTDPTYMDQYTAALFLPHTDVRQFPSVMRPNGNHL